MEPAQQNFGREHMAMYSSSVTSIEGCNHALKFTDSHGELRWQLGMKTMDETPILAK
jgi:hypothetical protein